MKSQTQFFKILFLFASMIISGCGDSHKTKVKSDTNALTPEPILANISKSEPILLQKPLNCPLMLAAYSGSNRSEKQDWLSFSFKENPDFDADLGDACKGDLKIIWTDLTRFEEQIENHMPYIKQFFYITSYLEYFPQTKKEMRTYMNEMAANSLLSNELIKIDRSTLDGGREFNMKVIQFIQMNEENYWMKEHAPIIESTLLNYGLKMEGYHSEKSFFCYHLFDVCKIDGPATTESTVKELDFEYMRPGFDWFTFQKLDAEIGQ